MIGETVKSGSAGGRAEEPQDVVPDLRVAESVRARAVDAVGRSHDFDVLRHWGIRVGDVVNMVITKTAVNGDEADLRPAASNLADELHTKRKGI